MLKETQNFKPYYRASDLSIIIPTKDRPQKLRRVLDCLHQQTVRGFRVLIVDGGTNAKQVVDEYQSRLNITYRQSPVPGQIHQRNLGIAQLEDNDYLVGFIDDDMELAGDSIEKVLALWNAVDPDPAGIGFNLIEDGSAGNKLFKKIFLLGSATPGKVIVSGANTGIANIKQSMRTQWLGGGYTIWRKDIILENPHQPVNTRWAIGEDLRFSYPIGKQYPLWVCSEATAKHNHVYRAEDQVRFARYRGMKIVMSSLFFVHSHTELSLAACYWMLAGLCIGRIVKGIYCRKRYLVLEGIGMAAGIVRSAAAGANQDFILSKMEN